MASKKKQEPITRLRRMMLKHRAGMADSERVGALVDDDELPSLSERISKMFNIINNHRNTTNMIYFVMYDIESNKVRRAVVKYLERQGCHRIQKSIFMADTSGEVCRRIREDLAEVQALYDNHDSIMVVPVSVDYVRAMTVIGQDINLDLILHNKGTVFF